MLPLGHAAFAYCVYAGVTVTVSRRGPIPLSLLPLAVASQLPDLIDKPLVYLQVLPSGRALGHSLLTFGLFTLVVGLVYRKRGGLSAFPRVQQLVAVMPAPFIIGYLTHLIGDSYHALLSGQLGKVSYLLYPLLSPPIYPADAVSPWMRLVRAYQTPGQHGESYLIALAVTLFVVRRLYAYYGKQA